MAYQLITIQQREEWTSYVQRSRHYDFYHTWYYHSLMQEGTPFLFLYEEEDVFVAIPLIKRKIDHSDLYDLTSAYGYTGPMCNLDFEMLSTSFIDEFRNSFLEFMQAGRQVCVFSRLNPFSNQEYLLHKIGGIYRNGETVYIDLRVPIETQRAGYEKRLARKIRQLRGKDFMIKETNEIEDIKVFTSMYIENMKRNGATDRYLYDEDYFNSLLNTTESHCKLIMVYHENQAICGNIVMYTDDIIRNHLSATATAYVSESPSKLLVDEISLIGRDLGIPYYHLGGGLNGKADSLFQFKASFSSLTLEDKTWCFVADTRAYEELVSNPATDHSKPFFPQYRSII